MTARSRAAPLSVNVKVPSRSSIDGTARMFPKQILRKALVSMLLFGCTAMILVTCSRAGSMAMSCTAHQMLA